MEWKDPPKFWPKQKVILDGDKNVTALVHTVKLRPDSRPLYEVEWWDCGSLKSGTFEEFRLLEADK